MANVASLRPPKYRLHKAKGLAVVTLNGHDHYLGKFNSAASKEAYRRLVAEHLLGGPVSAAAHAKITVAEIMARPRIRYGNLGSLQRMGY